MALFFILESIMTSEVSICNLALAHLGDAANISDLNEASASADHCKMFYPIARDLLLEMGPWNFNTRRTAPAALDYVPPSIWTYAYALPSNVLRVLAVLPPYADDKCVQPFIMETIEDGTQIILTDMDAAIVRYTVKITDTSKFSPLFVDTLSWLLASYVAGPLIKGTEGINAGRAAYATFTAQLAHAQASDNNQQYEVQQNVSATTMARFGYGLPGMPGYNQGGY